MNAPAGPYYTLAEAAEKLRKGERWLADWLRANPVDGFGVPFYSPLGRTKTFDDSDIERIRAVFRDKERERLERRFLRYRSKRRPRASAGQMSLAEQLKRVAELTGRTPNAQWQIAAKLTGDPTLANGPPFPPRTKRSRVQMHSQKGKSSGD